ncbi:hypothetical protein MRX96_013453 [Rhipicephalus microplus]
MDQESYRFFEGVWMHTFFRDEAIRSAIDYKHQDGDVIVVTSRNSPESIQDRSHYDPSSVEGIQAGRQRQICVRGEKPIRLRCVLLPLPEGTDPKDCHRCFFRDLFSKLFLSGKVIYGDYFDHLLPWYERRNEANVFFLTYEQLKADTKAQILKIADFLGEDHGSALREDDNLLEKVLQTCSLESMKWVTGGNYFTEEQIKETKNWIAKKTQGSDVMTLWSDCDLP